MPSIQDFATRVIDNVEHVIIGKREAIELLMVALLCEGHVLIEDVPGVGKTMLARSIAISLGGQFKRLQCTPDLLPNDVTGVSVFNQQNSEFEFRPGPIFVNVLLADEINRATPRTQSALLEAMQEQQVTVDGVTRSLPRPFMVLATQNPIEYEGTFPLPEAQLDRFLMRLALGYPNAAQEKQLLPHLQREHPITKLQQVTDEAQLLDFQKQVWEVHVDESLQDYIVALVTATRDPRRCGARRESARVAGALQNGAGVGRLRGRDHVIPDDVKYLAPFTLAHRLIVKPEAELRGQTALKIVGDILERTPLNLDAVTSSGCCVTSHSRITRSLVTSARKPWATTSSSSSSCPDAFFAIFLREDSVLTLVYFLVGVYALSRWWSRRALKAVEYKRTFQQRAFLYEKVPVQLEVVNHALAAGAVAAAHRKSAAGIDRAQHVSQRYDARTVRAPPVHVSP